MRKLAFVPFLLLAVACGDSTLVQPDDLSISAAAAPRTVLTWQETLDQYYAQEQRVTPGGVVQLREFDIGFFVTGDLEGYDHIYGVGAFNLKTGTGSGAGTIHYDLTSPGVGTLECNWQSKMTNFPVLFVHYIKMSCKGTGYYEGWKLKVTGSNENNPGVEIYDYTAEVR